MKTSIAWWPYWVVFDIGSDRLRRPRHGLGSNDHRALMYPLGMAGFDVEPVLSIALARTREALHDSWDKNDPKDAPLILHMLQIGARQVFVDPLQAGINDIQKLSKMHEVISKAKTELWHRILGHFLPLHFPDAARFQHRS